MICAISGITPEEPVVSIKSGHVFEKRLIEKYLDANGKCPVTNDILEQKDLIPVKVNKAVKPRPVTATSIPSMLQLFQNEWDGMMLETYTLKQHLETVRQELAHALYQHDAACRVIARLMKERDSARSTLSSLSAQLPEGHRTQARESNEAMEVDGGAAIGMSEAVAKKLEEKSKGLSKDRKKRQQSPNLATADALKEYKVVSSNNTHKASAPGVLCLDIHPQQELIVTGGVDATAVVFNRESGKIVSTLNGHTKRVNDVLFHPSGDVIITASQDKTARVWRSSNNGAYTSAHVVKTHTEEVSGISLHATGDYFATTSYDRSWGFHDIHTGACLLKVQQQQQAGLSAVAFHPDGLILGTGTTDSYVRIWDVKSQENAASFEGHTGKIVDISFSENGFYLATAAEDSIKLWDLRKLSNFFTIPIDGTISAVNFDFSGNYLAVAGSHISIYSAGKTFTPVQVYKDHSAAVTEVKFGRDASFFASTSLDRSLKVYSK